MSTDERFEDIVAHDLMRIKKARIVIATTWLLMMAFSMTCLALAALFVAWITRVILSFL